MSNRWYVRHWATEGDRPRRAVELVPSAECEPLSAALVRLAADPTEMAFIVVRIAGLESAVVDRALDDFRAAGGRSRICLAGSWTSLSEAAADCGFDVERVGLLLDDIDADTPLAQLLWDRVEACRFAPGFSARAARDVRYSCALDALLGLARDLGLGTLGIESRSEGAGLGESIGFDYRPCTSETPARSRPRVLRARSLPVHGKARAVSR